ncbi:acid protease [Mollisia scopiformis]|uniref:Acid protease n=1 Tax=Mollisia scopiformis TaxID=149040 RepID=A0A194XCN3_MOLSC|nr:acid protease [Mollisia scopiformis]KUJ17512.1 acid protease [Mollisia scopiformis]
MLSTLSILALALAIQAAPAPRFYTNASVAGPSVFSAPAIHNENYVRNGTLALLKAYAKYGLTPSQEFSPEFLAELSQRKQKRQDSSAPASPSNGIEYLVPTSVGGQTLNLDFDTGSADLWVFSTSLSAAYQRGHNVFSTAKSATYKPLTGYTWRISYADGSGASGTVGTDTVTVGTTSAKNQAVELASRVSSTLVTDASDGVLGLAFSSINTVSPAPQKTFFDNVKASLQSPLFAAYLPYNKNGAYDFGATVASRYSGTITYTAVNSANGFWQYPSTTVKVGSTTHSIGTGSVGISDTGTTLVLMVDSAVTAYYSQVAGASYDYQQGGYVFPCAATLPTLSVAIGPSAYATIPGSLIKFQSLDGTTCFGGLQSAGTGNQNIYGDVFFNAFYAVFDASGPRFGFAPLV